MDSDFQIAITYFLAFLLIPIYHFTKSFKSIRGLIFFLVALGITISRLLLIDIIPISIIRTDTLLLSFFLVLLPPTLFVIFDSRKLEIFKRLEYFKQLLFYYFIFGVLQQLYFLHVFGDLTKFLLGTNIYSYLLITGYFYFYHLKWLKYDMRPVLPILLITALASTYAYLFLGNSIVQMVFHGFFGSYFFTAYNKDDQIKNRLG